MGGEARCLAPRAFRAGAAGRVLLSTVLLLIATAGSSAFGSALPESNQPKSEYLRGRPAVNYASLLANLRATGVRAKPGGRIVQPFFSVSGKVIQVNGEDVQVFQYRDAARTDAQAALLSPDGSTVGTTKVHWLGPPHFYKREKLLVLYLGENHQVLRALEASLGHQFAGKQC